MSAENPEPGRIKPPYGGMTDCANNACENTLNEDLGAYMFKDHEIGKLVLMCGDCARHVELNYPTRFTIIAL